MEYRWTSDWLSSRLDSSRPDGRSYVFRQGIAMAVEAARAGLRQGDRWADIGCGTGHLTAALADLGANAVGLDIDPDHISYARARFGVPDGSAGPRFETAEATSLPFDDGSLHGIVAVSLAGCLSNPSAFFAEARRVLLPGGALIVTFTNRRSIPLRFKSRVSRLLKRPANAPHGGFRLYASDEVRQMVDGFGFEVAVLRPYNYCMSLGRWLIPPVPIANALQGLHRLGGAQQLANNLLLVAAAGRAPPGSRR